MNVPAIAKQSFDRLRHQPEFANIVNFVLKRLGQLKSKIQKARFVHDLVDEYNQEVFAHPLVQQFSPCKLGCTGCCHTQVSISDAEAELLSQRVNEGVAIDLERLRVQMSAGDDSTAYFKIPYEQRRCVFLGDNGGCRVYDDRPSVCRTNAVLGDASQCDTRSGVKPTRLVLTPKADMVIYASYLEGEGGGTLPHMLGKRLLKK